MLRSFPESLVHSMVVSHVTETQNQLPIDAVEQRSLVFDDIHHLASDIFTLLSLMGKYHFVVMNREVLVESRAHPHFDLHVAVGLPINKRWIAAQAMEIQQPLSQAFSQEESTLGVAYMGCAAPLFENGRIIGAIGWYEDTDAIEKHRQLIEHMNIANEQFATTNQHLHQRTCQTIEVTSASQDRLEQLKEMLTSVSNTVETVTKIANQTQILGLNAAIEAARITQDTNGFTHVARDIRKLSVSTKTLAVQIEKGIAVLKADVATLQAQYHQIHQYGTTQLADITNMSEKTAQLAERSQELQAVFAQRLDISQKSGKHQRTDNLTTQGIVASAQRLAPILFQVLSLSGYYSLAVADQERIVTSLSSEHFDLGVKAGDVLTSQWISSRVQRAGHPMSAVVDKEQSAFQSGYDAYAVPLKEDGKVVGALVFYQSTEIREKKNALTCGIHAEADELSTLNHSFDKSTKAIDKTNEAIQNGLHRLLASFATITQASHAIIEVAENIRVLGLNAAIESSHADQSGRCFIVVAEEISKLADSSRQFASEINTAIIALQEQISQIQTQVENARRLGEQQHSEASVMAELSDCIIQLAKEQYKGEE
jgi:methyl-accepting chemotaxis protein